MRCVIPFRYFQPRSKASTKPETEKEEVKKIIIIIYSRYNQEINNKTTIIQNLSITHLIYIHTIIRSSSIQSVNTI